MAKIKELVYDIEDAINQGLDIDSIAKKFNVPVYWVAETADMIAESELEVRDEPY